MPNESGPSILTAVNTRREQRFLVFGRRTLLKFLLSASGLIALLHFIRYGSDWSSNTTTLNLQTESRTEIETTTGAATETTTEIKYERMKITNLSQIPPGSDMTFSWPPELEYGSTNILIRDKAGNVRAFNLICTHLGCLAHYDPKYGLIVCPCHGSVFSPDTGEVTSGPAQAPLPRIILEVDEAGDIYAVGYG